MASRSDPLGVAFLLGAVGGGMDGYAFVIDGVFANAQSGNLVLLGIGLVRGDASSVSVLVPIAAFVVGTLATTAIAGAGTPSRRGVKVALLTELAALLLLALLAPPKWLTIACLAFIAAVQTSTFRRIRGRTYSTTMTTADLRLFVLSLWRAATRRDRNALSVALAIGGVLIAFCLGAGATAALSAAIGSTALLALTMPLLAVLMWSVRVPRLRQ